MMNKRAESGEALMMIYRLFLVVIMAFVILGLGAIYYDYYIDVRYSESGILAKEVVNCVSPEGTINLSLISVNNEEKILEYCGVKNIGRFYVKIQVLDDKGNVLKNYNQGDSGAKWILDIYNNVENTENIAKYEPGFFSQTYNSVILNNEEKLNGKIYVEVLVQNEL